MPWGHVRTLLDKVKSVDLVSLYAQACFEHGWSRTVLEWQIDQRFHERRRYITASLKREFASESGTELNAVLPKMSPLNPQYLTKKQSVFQKIAAFVEKFKGVGGVI